MEHKNFTERVIYLKPGDSVHTVMELNNFTERVIYLKPGDSVHTVEGRIEIIHYCGKGTWFVREYEDVYGEPDEDGLPEYEGEQWKRDYTVTDKELQRKFYELTGHICCFFPEKGGSHE